MEEGVVLAFQIERPGRRGRLGYEMVEKVGQFAQFLRVLSVRFRLTLITESAENFCRQEARPATSRIRAKRLKNAL